MQCLIAAITSPESSSSSLEIRKLVDDGTSIVHKELEKSVGDGGPNEDVTAEVEERVDFSASLETVIWVTSGTTTGVMMLGVWKVSAAGTSEVNAAPPGGRVMVVGSTCTSGGVNPEAEELWDVSDVAHKISIKNQKL